MKKSLFLLCLLSAGFFLAGYGPRSYSDLATYRHVPISSRINSLTKAGEDLFLRRRYEEARAVFQMVLGLDKNDLGAKAWLSKINHALDQEKNEEVKKSLYKKWGHLTPIDKIYDNWHWGPEVGHFEVRYSESKPYVPAVRKFRPKASDEEIKEALDKYKKSKTAENAFELAMKYWSQRKKQEAVKYYFEAVGLKPEILRLDDEYMISMISEELEGKNQLTAEELLTYGRLSLVQGNSNDGIKSLIRAAMQDKNLKSSVKGVLENYLSHPSMALTAVPAEIYSFRQAYVFDKEQDSVYMRIILSPRGQNLIVPIDTSIPASYVANITIESKEVMYCFSKAGIEDSARLWLALPEKTGDFPEYEIRLIVNLKRGEEEGLGIELSNYALPPEQEDNWSFIISSEFNDTEGTLEGDYEKVERGVRVSGYHLGSSNGKGPYIPLDNYKEPLPQGVKVWQIIESKEGDMSLL